MLQQSVHAQGLGPHRPPDGVADAHRAVVATPGQPMLLLHGHRP